uniref:Uncharacterized protein n=1 Tax=Palpitomonas bilix TaxID=652834 RepID=A0A7S3D6K2_9EUKA|mmetsp:Transcript_24507/g.62058  ORF Transcript_24507/g.62058 Transcript_24507/m.62058 type:complete len:409 (+) Transcript_24507:187-1413(+)
MEGEAEVSECIEVPDKKDPSYESKYGLGASFSTPEELRMAIRLWHFHHTKTFKYKKNNLKKLEASCDQEEDCSFYLLALKKGDKLEVTKTTPHSCSQLTYTDDLAQKSLGRAYFKANELVHLFPTGMEISRSTVQEVLEKPHGFSSLFFETGYSKTLIKNIQVAAKKLQRKGDASLKPVSSRPRQNSSERAPFARSHSSAYQSDMNDDAGLAGFSALPTLPTAVQLPVLPLTGDSTERMGALRVSAQPEARGMRAEPVSAYPSLLTGPVLRYLSVKQRANQDSSIILVPPKAIDFWMSEGMAASPPIELKAQQSSQGSASWLLLATTFGNNDEEIVLAAAMDSTISPVDVWQGFVDYFLSTYKNLLPSDQVFIIPDQQVARELGEAGFYNYFVCASLASNQARKRQRV